MAEKSKKIPTFSSQVLDDFQVHLQSAQALAGHSFVSRTAVPVPRTFGKTEDLWGSVGSGGFKDAKEKWNLWSFVWK